MPFSRTRLSPRIGALTALAACSLALVSALGIGSAQAATLPTLNLSLTASTIIVSGSPSAGAVNVVTTATGVKESSAILVKLKPGVTPAEVLAFLATKGAQDPNNASRFGSIVYDVEASTGQTVEAQTTLEAGEYVALAGAGEGPPKAHTAFKVASSTAPIALPAAAATERSIEFAFKGPSTLHDGELVRFENEGFLVHMDLAFPTKSRATAVKAMNDLITGREKAVGKLVAGQPITFAGPLSSGSFQQETITAKPGWYVQVCFMGTQDGRSHARLGMERIIKITK